MTGVESRGAEPGPPATDWDAIAPWWRETFSNGADLEYELQILPVAASHLAGRERILDVGTGEGQLARRLVTNVPPPALVAGIDPYFRQLANALEQGGGPVYAQARGEQLPFPAGAFDGVVCCLVIEHADDPDAVLAEMVRVLAPGGVLLLLINHPVVQGPGSGFVDDRVLDERYWRIGPYLTEQVVVEEVDPGVPVRFSHRPLSGYINPLCDAGLVLTRLEEPEPPLEFLSDSYDLSLERAMPRLCLMCFEHRVPTAGVGQ
ncbi:MAG: class I SAM-dependent methyltransferase [Acidimicrobiales bacterium]